MSDWSVGNINLLPIIRVQAGAACIAAGLGLYVTNPSIVSPMLPLAAVSMWCGVILSPRTRPPWPILAALAVIILSALIAIPLSKHHLAPTVLLAILTISVAPLVLVKNPYIWRWLTPVWILHGVFAFWQWFVVGSSRVVGIADNANVAAVFLLLGSTYLLNGNGKARWMMIPLLMAILFTGSRWTVGVASVALLTIFLSRYVNWRYVAVGMIASVGVTLMVIWPDAAETWIRPNTAMEHITGEGFSSEQVSNLPSFVPRGFFDNGIHSVPLRMTYETGLLSGVAWVGATVFALWRRPTVRWWMLLVVALVSLMYYHTWVGPLAGFWWLLINPYKTGTTTSKPVAVYEPYKPG